MSRDQRAEGARWLAEKALPDGIPATTFTGGQASLAISLAAEVVEFATSHLGS